MSCRKIKNSLCEEERFFFCELEKRSRRLCPKDYFPYKGDCLYKSPKPALLPKAKEQCANRGGQILDIKSLGIYKFIQLHSILIDSMDLHLGFNFTDHNNLVYADGSKYDFNTSFDFDGENVKFGGLDCVFLKRGIGYKPREIKCFHKFEFYCIWHRKKSSNKLGLSWAKFSGALVNFDYQD